MAKQIITGDEPYYPIMGWIISDTIKAKYETKGYGALWRIINGQRQKCVLFVDFPIEATDYLRSISILIPWRGNSCDDLIASGVAVYREERKEGE